MSFSGRARIFSQRGGGGYSGDGFSGIGSSGNYSRIIGNSNGYSSSSSSSGDSRNIFWANDKTVGNGGIFQESNFTGGCSREDTFDLPTKESKKEFVGIEYGEPVRSVIGYEYKRVPKTKIISVEQPYKKLFVSGLHMKHKHIEREQIFNDCDDDGGDDDDVKMETFDEKDHNEDDDMCEKIYTVVIKSSPKKISRNYEKISRHIDRHVFDPYKRKELKRKILILTKDEFVSLDSDGEEKGKKGTYMLNNLVSSN